MFDTVQNIWNDCQKSCFGYVWSLLATVRTRLDTFLYLFGHVVTRRSFGQVWTRFGHVKKCTAFFCSCKQFWSRLDTVCTRLDTFGYVWADLDSFGHVWTRIRRIHLGMVVGHIWTCSQLVKAKHSRYIGHKTMLK